MPAMSKTQKRKSQCLHCLPSPTAELFALFLFLRLFIFSFFHTPAGCLHLELAAPLMSRKHHQDDEISMTSAIIFTNLHVSYTTPGCHLHLPVLYEESEPKISAPATNEWAMDNMHYHLNDTYISITLSLSSALAPRLTVIYIGTRPLALT